MTYNYKKNFLAGVISMGVVLTVATGCGGSGSASSSGTTTSANKSTSGSDMKGDITVVSREDGSGTRGAFIELVGIQQKDADGNKKDLTTKEAVIAPKTDVMLTTVSGDKNAIGYVSLGSLNDNVKALSVDGVEATADAVKGGEYKVARPFLAVTKGTPSGLAADFMSFILSKDGQSVVTDNKYVAVNDAGSDFTSDNSEGKLVIVGSSSVSPVMEKLAEKYQTINLKAEIEIQTSDSTSGINATVEDTCDIGMASRELTEDEKKTVTPTTIAVDGIAVIVSQENSIEDLSADAIRDIYKGEVTKWEDVVTQ